MMRRNPAVLAAVLGLVCSMASVAESASVQEAAGKGDLAAVQKYLNKGGDINARGRHGRTALFEAAANGRVDVLTLLLEKGAAVNLANDFGWTPLHVAVKDLQIMRLLMQKGADVNAPTTESDVFTSTGVKLTGLTPLLEAADRGKPEAAALLLENGADLKATDRAGGTALMYAARRGRAEMVRLLLDKGADPNAVDAEGWTAAGSALRDYESDAALLLIRSGAEIRLGHGQTAPPWVYALEKGLLISSRTQRHSDLVKHLLHLGAATHPEMAVLYCDPRLKLMRGDSNCEGLTQLPPGSYVITVTQVPVKGETIEPIRLQLEARASGVYAVGIEYVRAPLPGKLERFRPERYRPFMGVRAWIDEYLPEPSGSEHVAEHATGQPPSPAPRPEPIATQSQTAGAFDASQPVEVQLQEALKQTSKVLVVNVGDVVDKRGGAIRLGYWAFPVSGVSRVEGRTVFLKKGTPLIIGLTVKEECSKIGATPQQIANEMARYVGTQGDPMFLLPSQKSMCGLGFRFKAEGDKGKAENVVGVVSLVEQE